MNKVIIIIPSLGGGGAEKVCSLLASDLSDSMDVTIIITYNDITEANKLRLGNKVNVIILNKKKVSACLFQYIKIIRSIKPDVVITSVAYLSLLFSTLIPILPKTIKYIVRETNIPSLYNKQKSFIERLVYNFIYKIFYKNYDLIVCQSNDMLLDMQKVTGIIEDKKFLKINNPIEFNSNKSYRVITPPISGDFVLAAGRLTYQKGFDTLINYFSKIDTDMKLLIVGEGGERGKLEGMIKALGMEDKVILCGFTDNIADYFLSCKFFILSSRFEGFPNVVLEAMSYGCPVLAADCPGGINEIIIEGVNGVVFKQDDVESFSQAFSEINGLNYKGVEIIESVKERYSLDIIMNEYRKVFH
ncbi:glycosyltransferase [Serratia fonticola]|uniref:glycosyltransferase n=1 Tax=Serratia fonticola TaxID=47917 RepID=UPI003AAE05EF